MSAKRPNILLIVSDDQGHWAMNHAGTPEIHTPNLDRLARNGKRLEAFYCVSPVCSPARASLLTGRIPSAHGVHDWIRAGNASIETEFHDRLIRYLDGHPTFIELLAQAGYTCGLSGKWHLGDSHRPHRGFSYWKAYATGGGSYQAPTMIRDGVYTTEDIDHTPRIANETNPRTGLGMIDPGHFVAIVVDGRQKEYSYGMRLTAFGELFVKEGCLEAYNLDGGVSACMLFMGEQLNRHGNKRVGTVEDTYQRRIPDGLVWGYSDTVPSEDDPIYHRGEG